MTTQLYVNGPFTYSAPGCTGQVVNYVIPGIGEINPSFVKMADLASDGDVEAGDADGFADLDSDGNLVL